MSALLAPTETLAEVTEAGMERDFQAIEAARVRAVVRAALRREPSPRELSRALRALGGRAMTERAETPLKRLSDGSWALVSRGEDGQRRVADMFGRPLVGCAECGMTRREWDYETSLAGNPDQACCDAEG